MKQIHRLPHDGVELSGVHWFSLLVREDQFCDRLLRVLTHRYKALVQKMIAADVVSPRSNHRRPEDSFR